MSSFNMVKIWDGIPTITLTGYAVDSTVYKMLDHAGRAVPYGRARENRASHMGKQRLSHGVTTIGFCYGTSGTLGTEGAEGAEGADAQERVPPYVGRASSLRWESVLPTFRVRPPYVPRPTRDNLSRNGSDCRGDVAVSACISAGTASASKRVLAKRKETKT